MVMPRLGKMSHADTAVRLFDWSQRAADLWVGSNNTTRREILDSICLNRTVSNTSLVTEKRKPFDVFAEGLDSENSRGDKTPLELFLGLAGWDAELRRQLDNSKSRQD